MGFVLPPASDSGNGLCGTTGNMLLCLALRIVQANRCLPEFSRDFLPCLSAFRLVLPNGKPYKVDTVVIFFIRFVKGLG